MKKIIAVATILSFLVTPVLFSSQAEARNKSGRHQIKLKKAKRNTASVNGVKKTKKSKKKRSRHK